MKKVLIIVLAAMLLFSAAACSSAAQPSEQPAESAGQPAETAEQPAESGDTSIEAVDTVKIGVLMPLTGSQSAIGNRQCDGIQLAVDLQNENGGIASLGGAKIELVVADTQSDSNIAVTEAERLIT